MTSEKETKSATKTPEEARPAMLDDDMVMAMSDLFKVFGDSTRIRILWMLDGGEMSVQSISGAVGLSMSAVSHQLKYLKDMDLVTGRREGKQIFYSLCDDHVRILLRTAQTHLEEAR